MLTFAITGSSGYLGTRMTRRLLEDPANRVVGIDVRPPRVVSDRLEFHELDVRDPKLADLLAGREVRSLLHFAFILDPLYDEEEMRDIDLGGTANVLRAALKAKIPHLLATSSTTAYGALPDNPVPLREEDPCRARPEFRYAHDKRLMDDMLREFAANHPEVATCILRPCIVLGPNVQNYIATLLLAQPVATLLDGNDVEVQFVHEDDLVDLVTTCLDRTAAGIYNCVGEGLLHATELAAMQDKRPVPVPFAVARAVVWAIHRLRLTEFAMPPGLLDFFRYPWVASGDKAKRELGIAPRYTSRACFDIILQHKQAILDAAAKQLGERRERGKR